MYNTGAAAEIQTQSYPVSPSYSSWLFSYKYLVNTRETDAKHQNWIGDRYSNFAVIRLAICKLKYLSIMNRLLRLFKVLQRGCARLFSLIIIPLIIGILCYLWFYPARPRPIFLLFLSFCLSVCLSVSLPIRHPTDMNLFASKASFCIWQFTYTRKSFR